MISQADSHGIGDIEQILDVYQCIELPTWTLPLSCDFEDPGEAALRRALLFLFQGWGLV